MIIRFLFTQLYKVITGEVHKLEYNATTQYNFHRIGAFFWLFCMVLVPFDGSFRSSVTALLIMEASLYANFTTDFGAMSAAMAAGKDKS